MSKVLFASLKETLFHPNYGTTSKELSSKASTKYTSTPMELVGDVINITLKGKDPVTKTQVNIKLSVPVSNFHCFEVEADAKDSKASNAAS